MSMFLLPLLLYLDLVCWDLRVLGFHATNKLGSSHVIVFGFVVLGFTGFGISCNICEGCIKCEGVNCFVCRCLQG